MPVLVVLNAKSVSAPDAVSRAIWDAGVRIAERRGAAAVLSTECADFRVADNAPAWATPVQFGTRQSPDSALAAYVRNPTAPAALVPNTGPANSPKGNTRARGVLRLTVDDVPVGLVHAPWQPEEVRNRYNAALPDMGDLVLAGDFNRTHNDVARLFPGRRVHSKGLMHVVVPAGYDSELLAVIGRKELHPAADHEALVVRVTRRTAPVVTPPKPTQPSKPEEPTVPISQNGFVANDRSKIETRTVPGTSVRLSVRKGVCGELLVDHVAKFFHEHIEPIEGGGTGFHPADDWGYAERPVRGSTTLSNHASGTAIDLNATRHPLGVTGTFTAAQKQRMNAYLTDELEGVVRWGENYTSRKDGMHFEIDASEAEVARVLAKVSKPARVWAPGERDLTYNPDKPMRSGDDVRAVQAAIKMPKGEQDGDYGPATAAAVKAWEQAWNKAEKSPRLKADGNVGWATWDALGVTRTYGPEKPDRTPPPVEDKPTSNAVTKLRADVLAAIEKHGPNVDADRPKAQAWLADLTEQAKKGPAA